MKWKPSPRCSSTPFMAPHPMQIYAKAPTVKAVLQRRRRRGCARARGTHTHAHTCADSESAHLRVRAAQREVMRGIDKASFPSACQGAEHQSPMGRTRPESSIGALPREVSLLRV